VILPLAKSSLRRDDSYQKGQSQWGVLEFCLSPSLSRARVRNRVVHATIVAWYVGHDPTPTVGLLDVVVHCKHEPLELVPRECRRVEK
jgi:hypothetical protein